MSATLQQIYNDLQNPLVDMGATAMGLGAFIREISGFLLKALTILKSPKGQAEIKDVATLAADFQQAATDAGHPAPAQVNQAVNTILAALPGVAIPPPQPSIPKLPVLLMAFLLAGLAAGAWADITLSGNFGAGGAVYGIQPGGFFEATGTIAATYGLNLAFVGTVTQVVTVPGIPTAANPTPADITENVASSYDYFIVSAGPSYEPHTTGMGSSTGGYLGAYLEVGTQIPATSDNLMAGIIGDFFTGTPEPIGGIVAVNFPLGQPWKTWQ